MARLSEKGRSLCKGDLYLKRNEKAICIRVIADAFIINHISVLQFFKTYFHLLHNLIVEF